MQNSKFTVIIEVSAPEARSFNAFWLKNILPVWEGQGGRHIATYAKRDDPTKLIRLLEFENEEAFAAFGRHMSSSDEGKAAAAKLSAFKFEAKTTFLVNAD